MYYDDKIKYSLTGKYPNLNFSYLLGQKVGKKWIYRKRDLQLADCMTYSRLFNK